MIAKTYDKAQLDAVDLAERIVCLIQQSDRDPQEIEENEKIFTPLVLFGIQLGRLRRKKGYDLDELASITNIDSNVIFAIELGEAPLEVVITNLKALGDALGCKYLALSRLLKELIFSNY